ncbi:MAG: four helix bundle protein [Fimbriimonadaceae bacterium]
MAEGSQRHGRKEFRQFVGIARGSCAELETLSALAVEFGYLPSDSDLHTVIDRCARLLHGLAKSLQAGDAVAAGPSIDGDRGRPPGSS